MILFFLRELQALGVRPGYAFVQLTFTSRCYAFPRRILQIRRVSRTFVPGRYVETQSFVVCCFGDVPGTSIFGVFQACAVSLRSALGFSLNV